MTIIITFFHKHPSSLKVHDVILRYGTWKKFDGCGYYSTGSKIQKPKKLQYGPSRCNINTIQLVRPSSDKIFDCWDFLIYLLTFRTKFFIVWGIKSKGLSRTQCKNLCIYAKVDVGYIRESLSSCNLTCKKLNFFSPHTSNTMLRAL